ncbi:MAG: glycoside hydrolase family 3 N-terminal domain-containing protein [Thomasclavelia sp.]|jgi:beta-N-acetylhexosaminidase|nr:glycoside hydrolase family 3 N-terminal domain-containing protein [Thomasclavelia sp.]
MKGRHSKSSKHSGIKIIISIIVVAVIIAGCYFVLKPKDNNTVTIPNDTKTLTGQIVTTGDQVVRVRLDNNKEYLLSTSSIKLGKKKLLAGNTIKVTYTGKLDNSNNDIQSIKLYKLSTSSILLSNVGSNKKVTQALSDTLKDMSLEEKVAQLMMVRCPDNDQTQFVVDNQPGGYILFGQDFEDKSEDEVISNISSYQTKSKIKMFIGTDEEGGSVDRLKSLYPRTFKSPQTIYNNGGMEAIINDTKNKAEVLKRLGLNINFAPVCDVSTSTNDFINSRSFGKGASETSEYVKNVVSTNNQNKMGSVLKHFPGYGSNGDSHTSVIKDAKALSEFESTDFVPFKAGIKAGANMVLVAHNIMEAVDSTNPASLSSKVHDILRNEMNYNGIIITDDLMMEGVRALDSDANNAVKAIQAGNDMILASNAKVQMQAIIDACNNGSISINQIDKSVLRILSYKTYLGII